MDQGLAVSVASCLIVLFVVLEYFLIKGSRERLAATQAQEWAQTQVSIRRALDAPGRQEAIAGAELRAESSKAYLKQVCESTATALRAPAAVITVVEHEGQKWLAYYGADWCSEDVREGLLQPLETSYCQYVVRSDETLVIVDSFKDLRVVGNDSATKRTVRAYLGAPVHTRDGVVVGSLCVFDNKPRRWSTRDRTVVESFADLVRL